MCCAVGVADFLPVIGAGSAAGLSGTGHHEDQQAWVNVATVGVGRATAITFFVTERASPAHPRSPHCATHHIQATRVAVPADCNQPVGAAIFTRD
jgi:hypothetical protein